MLTTAPEVPVLPPKISQPQSGVGRTLLPQARFSFYYKNRARSVKHFHFGGGSKVSHHILKRSQYASKTGWQNRIGLMRKVSMRVHALSTRWDEILRKRRREL